MRVIAEDGGRLDWSTGLNLIAFDRRGADGYYDVYTMSPDGRDVRCVTCDKPELPNKSIGNPAWHPSGEFIAFQAQNAFRGLGRITDIFASPGAGLNNDVWITDREGRRFWQITKVESRKGGVLHPHFSRTGTQLFWSERVDNGGSMGKWALRVADFAVGNGAPRVENIRSLQPGTRREFFESHGFSPDGEQIVFSGNLESGQRPEGMDIYLFNLRTQTLKNLTQSNDDWDEHAHFSPDGRTIVWSSSREQPEGKRKGRLRTDYWLMDPDGSNKRRLTHFNVPNHPDYVEGGAMPADSSWGPGGAQIAGYLIKTDLSGGKNVIIDVR
jgi:Tol biopolymer transport system component